MFSVQENVLSNIRTVIFKLSSSQHGHWIKDGSRPGNFRFDELLVLER